MEPSSSAQGAYYVFRPLVWEPASSPVAVFRLRLSGWSQIHYVSAGWQDQEGRYWHDRLVHVRQGEPFEIRVDPSSVAFRLANQAAEPPTAPPRNLRLVIKGSPGESARVDVGEITLRPARPRPYPILLDSCRITTESFDRWLDAAREEPIDVRPRELWRHLTMDPLDESVAVSEGLRTKGEYRFGQAEPITREKPGERPASIADSVSLRYRWQSLAIVRILIDAYQRTSETAYLDLAREHVEEWDESSFRTASDDPFYAWYDHGTADRMVALVLLWEHGLAQGYDEVFMRRLFYLVYRHGELLASETFYARNQPYRHHNHGVFQDTALIAASLVLPELTEATGWLDIALRRLQDQFDHLVTSEGASVENSLGYHIGLRRVCSGAQALIEEVGREAEAARLGGVCARMAEFERQMRYPDGTSPAFGDTWITLNGTRIASSGFVSETRPGRVYEESGYATFTSPTAAAPQWQVSVFNTSLSATHKQTDFLSFTLWRGGLEWLTDPGYHSYDGGPHASYASSARAHNAPLLCGRGYEPRPGSTSLTEAPGGVTAEHDAYPESRVRRRFLFDDERQILFVQDSLAQPVDCPDGSTHEVWLHVADLIRVELGEHGAAELTADAEGGDGIRVVPLWDARCTLYEASTEPVLAGWIYPDLAREAPAASWRCEIPDGHQAWTTAIVLAPATADASSRPELERRLERALRVSAPSSRR